MEKKKIEVFDPTEHMRLKELKGSELASFSSRAIAFTIDFSLAFALFLVILIFGTKLLTYLHLIKLEKNIDLKFDFENWYSIIFLVLYFGLFTYIGNGQTPGKKIMKIRVVSLLHERISLWHSLERSLGYGASALEFGFGFIQYFIHPNKRTVHDRIAETIVIKENPKMSGSPQSTTKSSAS